MKRLTALICAALVALSAAACGAPPAEGTAQTNGGGGAEPVQLSGDVLTDGEISGEITVSCYDTMMYKAFLDQAANAFQEKYPGTKVNIETFSAMPEIKTQEENGKKMTIVTKEEDSQGESDYINKINTELMGGKGADVLAMDVLPAYKYAENEQLENLRVFMEADPDFKMEDYRTNIFDALNSEAGQFIFPIDYAFNYFAFDSTLIDDSQQAPFLEAEKMSYEQIALLGAEAFNKVNSETSQPVYMFGLEADSRRRGASLSGELLKENYSTFIDINAKKANFTDGAFEELLNTVNEYADLGYIKKSTDAPGKSDGPMNVTPDMLEKMKDEHFFFKSKSSLSLMNEFYKNRNIRRMTSTASGNEENDKISGIASNDKGEVTFTYSQAYGINANSENKTTAWAFIKFLSQPEMQESLQLMYMPINIAAFREKAKMEITGELFMPENAGAELDEEGKAALDAYVAAAEKYTSLINSYFVQDVTIDNIIAAEVANYFSGSKSAAEVAEVLQNKISLYLNE